MCKYCLCGIMTHARNKIFLKLTKILLKIIAKQRFIVDPSFWLYRNSETDCHTTSYDRIISTITYVCNFKNINVFFDVYTSKETSFII